MPTTLESGESFLFIGDSITDCGRRDADRSPLGLGYVSYVRDFFVLREAQKQIQVINTGISGDTIEDLRNRWEDDAMSYRPDWLAIKVGINDCLTWCADPETNALQSPDAFARIYDQLLTLTRDGLPGLKIVLIDPFYASHDSSDRVTDSGRGRVSDALPKYLSVVEQMANKHGTLHVKTNDAFWQHFEHQSPSSLFPHEPVHPNQTGHMLIAEAVWAELSSVSCFSN